MFRLAGITSSFVVALFLAMVPALPAHAGVTAAAPVEEAEAPAATAPALAASLLRSGMTPEEAARFVAGLNAEERALVLESAPDAQAGGIIFLVPLVPFLIALGVVLGLVGTAAVVKGTQSDDAPKAPEAAPAAQAPASEAAPQAAPAKAAPAKGKGKGDARIITARP